jgi:hypothetical protein
MEPLFCIRSKYTEKEYVHFNRELISRNNSSRWVIIVLLGLFGIAFIAVDIHNRGQVVAGAVMVSISLFLTWWFTLGFARRARRYYANDKMVQDLEFELKFYDDHLEQFEPNGYFSMSYDKFHKIYVTKSSVCLMRSLSAGIFIPLADCPQGFVDFIETVKEEYNL